MRIPLRGAGCNVGIVNRGLNERFGVDGLVSRMHAGNPGELALYVGNHHVFYLELGDRVDGVDVPGAGGNLWLSECAHSGFLLIVGLDSLYRYSLQQIFSMI